MTEGERRVESWGGELTPKPVSQQNFLKLIIPDLIIPDMTDLLSTTIIRSHKNSITNHRIAVVHDTNVHVMFIVLLLYMCVYMYMYWWHCREQIFEMLKFHGVTYLPSTMNHICMLMYMYSTCMVQLLLHNMRVRHSSISSWLMVP